MHLNKRLIIITGIILSILLVYLCTITGITSIPVSEANKILLSKLFFIPIDLNGISAGQQAIIFNLRLPRVVLGFITGASLSVCGAAYQSIFKNQMADPYILGVSSGAALGAAVGIILHFDFTFFGLSLTTIFAFFFSFLTVILVYLVARQGNRVPSESLLLSGIAFSQTLTAFMSLIMIFNVESMNQIIFWTMGSLNGKGWKDILSVIPYIIIGIFFLFNSMRELDIMLLGEESALELGVDVEHLKRKILIASSLITAAVVSVTGIIGFVGLIVPHVVRLLTGPKHFSLMPLSLIFGGTFLVICDTLSRSFLSQEIPVGIITAAFGGPFFIYLLKSERKNARG